MKSEAWAAALLIVFFLPAAAQQKAGTGLPDKYKKWLEEEVVYIITAKERDVFLKLQSDREREMFIEAFWKQRDPNPGAPRNEFREEHYRRLQYANENFGRSSSLPGWKTDRGRIHIILGPPQNIESYEDVMNVYPTQIWFYLGDPEIGLPTAFNVIFFKKEGMGNYILYSPVDDGPESLIAGALGGFQNEQAAYLALRKLEPNLAREALTLIPGERVSPGTISLASNMLISQIYSAPQRRVSDSYAEALLKYKDSVEVEYTANYIGCEAQAQVFRSEEGTFLVHFTVEPQKLSLDEFEGKYTANFDLNGRLTDAAGRTVYQFDRPFSVSLTPSELEGVRGTTLALQDMFPCLPGQYKFDLLIKNTVSKEFATYEVGLTVPSPSAAGPALGAPLLAYGLEPSLAPSGEEVPFRVAGKQAVSQAHKIFTRQDTLFVIAQAYGLPAAWGNEGRVRFSYDKDGKTVLIQARTLAEVRTGETIVEAQPLAAFSPGYYDLTIALLDPAGQPAQSQEAHFEVSLAPSLPRPRILAKVLQPENRADWDYVLGLQAINQGELEEGRVFMGKAYARNPKQAAFVLGYAQSLFFLKDYGRARDVLLPLLKEEDTPLDAYALLGRTTHALGQYGEAIGFYREYLTRAGTNLEIMNLIGTCQYQMGDKAAALATWRRSLAINPKQEQIQKLVDSLLKK